ncbi:serine/threonine-protein kinase [Micromonospora sp. NPDC004551]|uniref:WD40 repeat domain-containing serine/threonine protein kinase n=1 Tax=Micromonospora sp. NPDC004551 TaxID=3154284 RepID=UPI0033AA3F8E
MREPGTSQRLVAGRYRLTGVLGRGGMGVVWRATDELIGRPVAVKEIRPPAALPEAEREVFARRALREARTAGRISHPGVVAIHDVVPADEDEAVYIVSELVPAPTLADVLRDGAVPPSRAAVIALRIIDALVAAHATGVVHRDVKPANIMLLDGDEVKLVDFGIAQAVDEARLTREGIMGSTGYLAPELFHGAQPTPGTDLWALGVTLWEAVQGQGPFDRGSTAATIHAVLHDDLPAPRCDPPLSTVITGLLTRDPADRMTLERARDLLRAGAAAPADEERGTDPSQGTDGPARPGRESWEQEPTGHHGDGPATAMSSRVVPRPRRTGGTPEEGETFRVLPPASFRRRDRAAALGMFVVSGGVAWFLLYATAGAPLLMVVVGGMVLWGAGLAAIRSPWQGSLTATEEGLLIRTDGTPQPTPVAPVRLEWRQVAEVLVVPAPGAPADRSRLAVDIAVGAPVPVLAKPPFKGFLRPQYGRGPRWPVGDVQAGADEVRAAVLAVVPEEVAVRPAGADSAPVKTPPVGPPRGKLVLWILLCLALLGGTFYYRQQNEHLVTLTGEEAALVAYAPDGRTLAGSADGTVTVWDAATHRKVAVLGVGRTVTALALNRDGTLLASGDEDGGVAVWNVATRRAVATFRDSDESRITSVQFSPDGALVAALKYWEAALWRLGDRQPVPLAGENRMLDAIRFSADGRVLLGIDRDGGRHFWQTGTGRSARAGGVFPPTATMQPDRSVLIRDPGTDRIVATLQVDDYVEAAAFGPGDLFATGGLSDVRIWRTTTGRRIRTLGANLFRWDGVDCSSLAMSPDGRSVACAGDDGVRLWTFAPEG